MVLATASNDSAASPERVRARLDESPLEADRDGRKVGILGWTIWFAALSWAVAGVLMARNIAATAPLVAFGLVAAWRYAWGATHIVRAAIFLGLVFPRLRRRAEAQAGSVDHVYGVISSYDIPPDQFRAVYSALFESCLDAGVPATLVASVTTDRDVGLLTGLLRRYGNPDQLRVIVQFQRGNGKRGAMAEALRTIAREHPPRNAVTLLLDGDVVLDRNAVRESIRFLAADPSLSALTTNNDAVLSADDKSRHWYWLRLAQRHVIMSSLALSGRLLVLTGRFSVYRTHLLAEPECIDILEHDQVDHWLHGSINFLSGDDKSLWQHVLNRGGRMLYLPHVKATAFEAMPDHHGFLHGSTQLMVRWLGNMVRANGRALSLGPRRCGPFLWWCLLDQRFAIFSTLFGVSVATCFALSGHIQALAFYLCWLFLSRTVMSSIYGAFWGYFSPAWPVFLAYNQAWGAMLKLYLFFRPDKQRWTRQHISTGSSNWPRQGFANVLFVSSLSVVVLAGAQVAGAI
jgi:glycosyltransferase Alg8